MIDIVIELMDLIETLEHTDKFKELSSAEIRALAIDLMKIKAEHDTGNAISNAITYIDYNNH